MTCPPLKISGLSLAAMLATVPLCAPATAQQRVEVGNAASVAGEVTLDNDQLRRPIEVQRRQRIAWGDLIETERNAQLQILLLDRSNFGIGQNSRVRIDRFVYNPAESRSVFVSFFKGALRFFSGADDGEHTSEVSTPAGRIGIRGTAIDMLVGDEAEDIAEEEEFVGRVRSDDDEATLVVLRGPGANALSGVTRGLAEVTGAGVTVVLDEPGLAAYIPREGAAPIGPFRISNNGLAAVQDEILPRWARSFSNGGIPDEVVVGAAAVVLGIILGTRGDDDDDPRTEPNSDDTINQSDNRICRNDNGAIIPCR